MAVAPPGLSIRPIVALQHFQIGPVMSPFRPPGGSPELLALMNSLRLPPGVSEPPAEVLIPLLYDTGLGIHRVASLCRRGPQTTRQILVDAGVEIRRPGTKATKRRKPPNVIDLYEIGLSMRKCAKVARLPWREARRQLVEAGVPIRAGGNGLAEPPTLVQLYRRGLSLEHCGVILGISRNTARNRLLKAGISPRPRGGLIRWNIDLDGPRLVSLYESGLSIEACSLYFKISCTTARDRLLDARVPLRKPGRSSNRRTRPQLIAPSSPLPAVLVPQLHELNFLSSHIALLTGHSHRAVHRELAKAGLRARVNPDPFGISLDGLVDVYRVVASVKDTATVLHLSRDAVLARLREAHVAPLDGPDPDATPVRLGDVSVWRRQDQTILALSANGESTMEIARTVGKAAAEVANILRIYRHRDRTTALVLRSRQQGESPGVTALRLGLRLDRIASVLARHPVKRRPAPLTRTHTERRAPALRAGQPVPQRELAGRR
ncbi:hypothetical protein ACIOG4_28245 [Streptomyces microflavus]|uniref:hypothetical protein n=1 Tax=Streptomyces microflavus TaxID=1919 RepID=UPI0038195271